jgi:hypothetical protein
VLLPEEDGLPLDVGDNDLDCSGVGESVALGRTLRVGVGFPVAVFFGVIV